MWMMQKFKWMQKTFNEGGICREGMLTGQKSNRARTIFQEEAPDAALKS
jgi:hypothetical protein